MILLLDARALLWWLGDDAQLSDGARSAIADPLNEVLVSAATVWEIEIKRALGKLQTPSGLVDALEPSNLGSLPITQRDAEVAARLPGHHRDPFDRMLVAQSKRLDAIVVTRDKAFDAYGVQSLLA